MLKELESHLYLYNFAPLLQLWAGICLLFFYEKLLLSNNPFEQSKQKCVRKIYDAYGRIRWMAMTRYQSYFMNTETDEMDIPSQLQPLADPNFDRNSNKKLDKYWMRFRRYIYNTAIVSFFYAIIVMCVAATEKYDYLVVNNFHKVLLVTNCMVVLHFFIISVTYKSKFSQCLFTHICFLLSMLIYIHIHMQLRDFVYLKYGLKPWCNIENGPVVICTLISCMAGMLFIIGNIFLSRIHTFVKSHSVDRINGKFAHMLQLPASWNTFRRHHPLVFLRVINKISKDIKRLDKDEGGMKILANRVVSFILLFAFCNDSDDKNKNNSFGSFHNNVYKMIDKMTVKKMKESLDVLSKTYYRFVDKNQSQDGEAEAKRADPRNGTTD